MLIQIENLFIYIIYAMVSINNEWKIKKIEVKKRQKKYGNVFIFKML